MKILTIVLFFILHFVSSRKPNFIVIVIDDLGYGDLGCFGNSKNLTPNIDKMSQEGVKFTNFISSDALCTPSRTGLLTGRYPIRSGMTSDVESFRTLNSPAQKGIQ
jgi:arylsulfatase A